MIARVSCRLGRHAPDEGAVRWGNSESGSGFNVTACRACGMELTRRPGSKWRATALSER